MTEQRYGLYRKAEDGTRELGFARWSETQRRVVLDDVFSAIIRGLGGIAEPSRTESFESFVSRVRRRFEPGGCPRAQR